MNNKIRDKWWFNTCDGHSICIVKTQDTITNEIKFRIGVVSGFDEDIDLRKTVEYGDKFFPERIKWWKN